MADEKVAGADAHLEDYKGSSLRGGRVDRYATNPVGVMWYRRLESYLASLDRKIEAAEGFLDRLAKSHPMMTHETWEIENLTGYRAARLELLRHFPELRPLPKREHPTA